MQSQDSPLRRLRVHLGYENAYEFGDLLGITAGHYSKLERALTPLTAEMINQLFDTYAIELGELGISLGDLYKWGRNEPGS